MLSTDDSLCTDALYTARGEFVARGRQEPEFHFAQLRDNKESSSSGNAEHVAHQTPGDGNCLFYSILRSLYLWKDDESYQNAYEIMNKRLWDAAAYTMDGFVDMNNYKEYPNLALMNHPIDKNERINVAYLRDIIATYLHKNFIRFYANSDDNRVQMQTTFKDLLILPQKPKDGAERMMAINHITLLKRIAMLDRTTPYIKDAFNTAVRYYTAGKRVEAQECLNSVRLFYNVGGGINRRGETCDAVVESIRLMGTWVFDCVLDVAAEILGVHIDEYTISDDQNPIDAVCTNSYGPQQGQEKGDLLEMYKAQQWKEVPESLSAADVILPSGFNMPLFIIIKSDTHYQYRRGVVHTINTKWTSHQHSVNAPDTVYTDPIYIHHDRVRSDGSGPVYQATPVDLQFIDPNTQSQENRSASAAAIIAQAEGERNRMIERGSSAAGRAHGTNDDLAGRLATAGALKNKRKKNVQIADRGARAKEVGLNNRQAAFDQGDKGSGASKHRKGGQGGGGGGGGGGGDGGGGTDAPIFAETSNTFKLRQFINDEYHITDRSAFTPIEENWAKEQMQKAHDSYVLHRSSRNGYGTIMLMTDAANTVALDTSITSAMASKSSRERTMNNFVRLKDLENKSTIPLVYYTQRLYDQVYTFHLRRIQTLSLEIDASLAISNNSMDVGAVASENAKQLLLRYNSRIAQEIADGFRATMSIIVNNDVFTENPSGGWLTYFAWFKASELQWNNSRPDKPFKSSSYGKTLCKLHADKATELLNRKNKGTQFWNAVCQFMEFMSNNDDSADNTPFFTNETLAGVTNVPKWDNLIPIP